MYARFLVDRAIKQLELRYLSIPVFQKVLRTPSGGFRIILKIGIGGSLEKLEEVKGQIAVAVKADEILFKKITANRVEMSARMRLPNSMPLDQLNQND